MFSSSNGDGSHRSDRKLTQMYNISWFQVNKLSLNTSKTNFMVFTNRSCDDTYSVCMNGLNLSGVFVTKFLGVHIYGL